MRSRWSGWTAGAGPALLVVGAGLFGWGQVREARAVRVPARVVATSCRGDGTSCAPVLEYATLDGRTFRLTGPSPGYAGGFEVGDEWTSVLYQAGDVTSARARSDTSPLSAIAVLLAIIGGVLFGLGASARVPIPAADRPEGVWSIRGMALGVGLANCISGYVYGSSYASGASIVPLGFVTAAIAVPSVIQLVRRDYPRWSWACLIAYLSLTVAAVLWLGLLALPEGLRPGLLAFVPAAAVLTLPLQARTWPALERALSDRAERAARRAELRKVFQSDDSSGDMLVRVDGRSLDDDHCDVLRRTRSGDTVLRASWDAFPRCSPEEGTWYLLSRPVLERRAGMGDQGYRDAEHEEWIARAAAAEALGPDLERALRVEPATPAPSWLLAVPAVVCVAVAGLGAWALADRTPPLSGPPIPSTGLIEGLHGAESHAGTIDEVSHWPGLEVGDTCSVAIEPAWGSAPCRVEVRCGGTDIYPGGDGGYTRCLINRSGALVAEDTSMTDGDPAVRVDTRAHEVIVRVRGGVDDRRVHIALGR